MRKIIHAVKGWISGTGAKGKNTAIVYVYASGKSGGGDINPNDQINVLRRLSTFTSKENIPVTIIFPGRPSRKIPDGSKQGGVQARYATSDQLKKVLASAIAEARKDHSVVVATNHPEVEKFARSERLRHIRATTFEKALDAVAGPLRRDQPQPPHQPRRQPQPQGAQPAKPHPAVEETATPEAPVVNEAPEAVPPQPPPTPQKPEPVPRKLHRYAPSVKKEERDQTILDLIDPL